MPTSPAARGPDLDVPSPVLLVPETEVRLRTIRRRLGGLLAAYVVGLQLALAIEATSWHWPLRLELDWPLAGAEMLVAMLRGAPLGYFVAFALRRRDAVARSVVGGAALGVVLELAASIDERAVHPTAVIAIALSAGVGAIAFLVLARRLRARAANDAAILAPDLPLVGGAYVSVPLLWLASTGTAHADRGAPAWCLVLLALYGASLIGSARASRGPAAGGLVAHVLAAAAWAVCGLAPLLPTAPLEVAAVASAAAAFAAVHPLLLGARARERRVEGVALRRALPLLLVYVLLASLGPLAAARAGRPGEWPTWASLAAATPPWRLAEQCAAFATLGYAAAELRARREERWRAAWRAVAPWLAAAAVGVTALRAAAIGRASLLGAGIAIGIGVATSVLAARAGVALYGLQRRHARAHALEGHGLRAAAVPPSATVAHRPKAAGREVDGVAWTEVVRAERAAGM